MTAVNLSVWDALKRANVHATMKTTNRRTRAMNKRKQIRAQFSPLARTSPDIEAQARGKTAVLRFTPHAWAKLLYMRDSGDTEVGGFGIANSNDLLLIEDFVTVTQVATAASVNFSDEAVADFFDQQVDAGRQPEQFARVWIHTHPGNCPNPSAVDEETFARVFGGSNFAIMLILANGGDIYARLRFNVGPGGEVLVPVEIDYDCMFAASDHEAWELEYQKNIDARQMALSFFGQGRSRFGGTVDADEMFGSDMDIDDVTVAELADMDPSEREFVLGELGCNPDEWAWRGREAEA
jgi:hypothetical protein